MSKQMSRWWRTDGWVTQRTIWVITQPLGLDCKDYLRLLSEKGSIFNDLTSNLQFWINLIHCFPRMVLVFENHRVGLIHNTFYQGLKQFLN